MSSNSNPSFLRRGAFPILLAISSAAAGHLGPRLAEEGGVNRVTSRVAASIANTMIDPNIVPIVSINDDDLIRKGIAATKFENNTLTFDRQFKAALDNAGLRLSVHVQYKEKEEVKLITVNLAEGGNVIALSEIFALNKVSLTGQKVQSISATVSDKEQEGITNPVKFGSNDITMQEQQQEQEQEKQ